MQQKSSDGVLADEVILEYTVSLCSMSHGQPLLLASRSIGLCSWSLSAEKVFQDVNIEEVVLTHTTTVKWTFIFLDGHHGI